MVSLCYLQMPKIVWDNLFMIFQMSKSWSVYCHYQMKRKGPRDLPARSSSGAIGLSPCILYQFIPVYGNIFLSESSEFLCPVCQIGFLIFRDYCKRAIRATQKTILGSFGIDEADAKARALAIGKELMYAEEPEKEEDEYGTFWLE